MDKFKITLLISNLFCIGAVLYLLFSTDQNKSAFFMSAKVYNAFDYKNELETDLLKAETAMNSAIDSLRKDLQLDLNYLKQITPTEDQLIAFERKQNYFLDFKTSEEEKYAVKAQESYGLIWDRINGYVQEFGKNNSYSYIYGANGDGSLMYADESEDITEDIIVYVNQRYAGE
ncbi:MAG: OmpH family outer membrane protein [Bacteroidetes bacterium]|nr:OmpH family outer membrane protein [Bacteroidota bacterium]